MAEPGQNAGLRLEMQDQEEKEDSLSFCSLREYEKMDTLLSQIPLKAQTRFLMTCDLILTCIDADSAFIVLGSNVGLVFVFSREDNSIQRIKVTGASTMISCVKLHEGTDHLLAVGTAVGHFNVYCIPAKASELRKIDGPSFQILKFEVKDVHRNYLTCLEWSPNGMKLCTGDTKGHVVVTEVDFYEDTCVSVVLLIDTGNEIVQLSYNHKVLAVSTMAKSYIVRLDLQNQVTDIGCEERNMPGKFGACFVPGVCKTEDALVYAGGVDCILWLATIKGDVVNAQAFSLPPAAQVPEIVLHSVANIPSIPTEQFQLGKLRMFKGTELVTWTTKSLVVLDPCANKVLAFSNNFENIVDVAVVNSGEIFVLQRRSSARIIRIADQPDPKLGKSYCISAPLLSQPKDFSQPEDKKSENYDNVALNFLKKSLVDPLKKLDHHINGDTERMMSSKEIPDAKVKSVTGAQSKTSTADEERQSLAQSTSLEESAKSDHTEERGSIVFAQKAKKHKKKRTKKESHIAPILGDGHDDTEGMSADDKSVLDVLRRADSLLDRLSPSKQVTDKHNRLDEMLGRSYEREPAKRMTSHEAREERLETQSVTSEESICKSIISDLSVNQDDSDLGGSGDVIVTGELHDQPCDSQVTEKTRSETGSQSVSLESTISMKDTGGRDIPSKSSVPLPTSTATNSSPDFLNECLERALESLDYVSEGNSSTQVNHLNVEEKNEHTKLDPLSIDTSGEFADSLDTEEIPLESPSEDLYSVYGSRSIFNDEPTPTLAKFRQASFSESLVSQTNDVTYQVHNVAPNPRANLWSDLKTPTNIYSVSISDSHFWYTDKTENIYFTSVRDTKNVSWKKASGKANQISVSPSGHIVWCLHKKGILAGTKISARHPEGLKWVEDAKDVEWISVDDNCAWYITQRGGTLIQPNLSLEQPLNRSKLVSCSHKLKSIMCRYGVVWAITERLQLLVRTGVSEECPEGKEWKLHSRHKPPFMFSHVSIGPDHVGWAVDILGQIWFCTNVTKDNPLGTGRWFQALLTDMLVHDDSTRQLIKEVAQRFDAVKFSHIISTSRGGLVTAGSQGVFVALDFKNVLNVCNGIVQGYHWTDAQPAQSPPASAWKLLCADAAHTSRGMVWTQHVNKDMYTLRQAKGHATILEESHNFCCLSANTSTIWALTADGQIMAREGIDDICPEGSSWQVLDLVQLGEAEIVHLGCSPIYVWAVDAEGVVYQRIGASPNRPDQLNPIWLPIDCFSEIVFTKVFAGAEEWMVWAIDNRRLVYSRKGVEDNLPIGKEWVHVTGIQATEITLSRTGAWALTSSGEVYYRHNVTKDNVCGDYWKRIPGAFSKISVSADDILWAVTLEGELQQCNIQHVIASQNFDESPTTTRPRALTHSTSVENEWELI